MRPSADPKYLPVSPGDDLDKIGLDLPEAAPPDKTPMPEFMVGNCPAMLDVFYRIRRFAQCDAPILISGETGTGKELAAQAVHQRCARNKGPFIAINCATLPASLIASELFGYEKGAFTGRPGARSASSSRPIMVRYSWTRLRTCLWICRGICCVFCKNRRSCGSAGICRSG